MAKEDVTTIDTIRDLKKSDPFAPLQIVMTSEDYCVIEDPDSLAISTSRLFYYPRTDEDKEHVNLLLVPVIRPEGD